MNNREKKVYIPFTFMMDDKTYEALKRLSVKLGKSKGMVIREAILAAEEAGQNGNRLENSTS